MQVCGRTGQDAAVVCEPPIQAWPSLLYAMALCFIDTNNKVIHAVALLRPSYSHTHLRFQVPNLTREATRASWATILHLSWILDVVDKILHDAGSKNLPHGSAGMACTHGRRCIGSHDAQSAVELDVPDAPPGGLNQQDAHGAHAAQYEVGVPGSESGCHGENVQFPQAPPATYIYMLLLRRRRQRGRRRCAAAACTAASVGRRWCWSSQHEKKIVLGTPTFRVESPKSNTIFH